MNMTQNWLKVLQYRVILMLCLLMPAARAQAFDAADTFKMKCGACHTVGGGVRIGPDLKGVTERRDEAWLMNFIPSPAKMIASGDPVAVELLDKHNKITMPDQALSPDEIRAILKFVEGGATSSSTPSIKSALEASPEDMQVGRNIFIGTKKLANGGSSCISCHSADSLIPIFGGTLATDLTRAYSKYTDAGLDGVLKTVTFPVMNHVFEKNPLTDEEIFYIKSFLYQVDRDGIPGQNHRQEIFFIGLGGMVLVLAVLDFVWRQRRKSSVRKSQGGLR